MIKLMCEVFNHFLSLYRHIVLIVNFYKGQLTIRTGKILGSYFSTLSGPDLAGLRERNVNFCD